MKVFYLNTYDNITSNRYKKDTSPHKSSLTLTSSHDSVEFSYKNSYQNITFTGFFKNLFSKSKSQKNENNETPSQISQVEKCSTVVDDSGNEAYEQQLKEEHNRRLHNILSTYPRCSAENSMLFGQLKDLLESQYFDIDIPFETSDGSKQSIFSNLNSSAPTYKSCYYPVFLPAILPKLMDGNHKISDDSMAEILSYVEHMVYRDMDGDYEFGLEAYKAFLGLETQKALAEYAINNGNFGLLLTLKRHSLPATAMIPDKNNPGKEISVAEASALDFKDSIYPFSESLYQSLLRGEENKENIDKIKDQVLAKVAGDFVGIIDKVDKKDESSQFYVELMKMLVEKMASVDDCSSVDSRYLIECFANLYSSHNRTGFEKIIMDMMKNDQHKEFPHNDRIRTYFDLVLQKTKKDATDGNKSILDIALDSDESIKYNQDFIDWVIKSSAKNAANNKLSLSEFEFPETLKSSRGTSNAERFCAALIASKPDFPERNKIVEYYKKLLDKGEKFDFSLIERGDNYVYAKLLLDAGVPFDSKDKNGKVFADVVKDLKDKKGNRLLPFSNSIESYLNYKNDSQNDKEISKFISDIFADLSDFQSIENKYLEISRVLEEKEDKYYSSLKKKPYSYKANIDTAKFLLSSIVISRIEDKFIDKERVDEFHRLVDVLNSHNKDENFDKAQQYVLLDCIWRSISMDTQKSMLKELMPLGIENFTFRYSINLEAAKLWLDSKLESNPDIRDGICTIRDLLPLYGNRKFSQYIYNCEINDDKETLVDILIKTQPQDEQEVFLFYNILLKQRLENSSAIDLNHCDKYGNNYAMKAVMAENIPMINFLLSKDVNFGIANNFGQTAIELAMKSSIPELKELFKDTKVFSKDLLTLAEIGSVSGMEMLLEKIYIDINSKDIYTQQTPWLIAATKGNIDTANFLMKRADVDFNAVDNNDRNFAMSALVNKQLDFIKQMFPKLSPEQLNLNYINKDNQSVYSLALKLPDEYLREILKLKSANPNISNEKHRPVAFMCIRNADLNKFKILAESGKLDVKLKYNNKSLQDKIKERFEYELNTQRQFLDVLNSAVDSNMISDVQKLVDKAGVLSLNNIIEFLKYPNIKNVISNDLSDSNEKIGHFLAEIPADSGNFMLILQQAKHLLELDSEAFVHKDKFGQTPLERALIAENVILFEYIAQNSPLTSFDIEKLQKLSENIHNEKIEKIIAKLKPARRSDDNQ